MKFYNTEWSFSGTPSGFDLSLIATIVVFDELFARLQCRAAHDCWYFFIALLQLLVPVLPNLAFKLILLLVELAELRPLRLQILELLVHFCQLIGELLFLLLNLSHHSFELLLALNSRLVLNLLVAFIAASEFVTVLDFGLSANLCLCLLATLFEGLDASPLKLSDWPVIEIV